VLTDGTVLVAILKC